jgi:Type II secretion system (T2SS), protein G
VTAGSPSSLSAAPEPAPRRAWPLLLLAACSFVPGLGFFLGAAAVTWALVTNRPRRKLAVALGATGALLNLVAPVVVMLRTADRGEFTRIQSEFTRQDLTRLVAELEQYRAQTGHYPATLQILVGVPIPRRLINIYDRSRGPFAMPRPYEYHLSADGTSYDLFSVGPDGVPHTADDIRPVVAESLRERVGYQPAP